MSKVKEEMVDLNEKLKLFIESLNRDNFDEFLYKIEE